MFVVIGNPPYNARQMDENDANKNRKYPELDRQIQETYVQAPTATNKTALYDPYVKAIHWALNRIETDGIVAFVTNHNFIDGQAFDGMRKHLSDACDKMYLLDLGGNIRKGHAGDANVFNIQEWDIFHYTYALLHHPAYRERYQVNLKRDLPHIPYAPKFWEFVEAGKRLADIHIHYEEQSQYKLDLIETPDMPLDWRVAQMKFSKDKTQIKYNDFLTLAGIPAEAFAYRLGNRSALEWVVDQYRVKTDKRSGIINDPNHTDDETYIVDLIRKVISVSLETVGIVERLSRLDIGREV